MKVEEIRRDQEDNNKLMVIEKADALAHQVYLETKAFPEEEFLGITLQLRKLALHIPIHVLEGINKEERKDLKKALQSALVKMTEIKYLLRFSFRLKYLSQRAFEDLEKLQKETDDLLWRFYHVF